MIIKSFIKTSLVDYPGQLASTIFLGGCNFKCAWCHNYQELVQNLYNGHLIPLNEIKSILLQRQKWIQHVCISGGEPTIWGNELINLCAWLKEHHFHVKLDTNGSNPNLIKKLIQNQLIDFIAMDIKNIPSKYPTTTMVPEIHIENILSSIQIIKNAGIPHLFRTTLVPNLVDKNEMNEFSQKEKIQIQFQDYVPLE